MTPQEQYEHLVETVKGYNPAAGFDQIRAAYEFADTHHAGQNRKDGSPFITHPLAVAQIVAEELHLDSESINTWKTGVCRALKQYIVDGTQAKGKCPSCGQENMAYQNGCLTCMSCGYSKCG